MELHPLYSALRGLKLSSSEGVVSEDESNSIFWSLNNAIKIHSLINETGLLTRTGACVGDSFSGSRESKLHL